MVSLLVTSTQSARRKVRPSVPIPKSSDCLNILGWTPSTFVSSRADRAKQKAAKPEDFMDEEDLQELKDGKSLVDTTDEMDLLGGTQAELNRRGGDPEEECVIHNANHRVSYTDNFLLLVQLPVPWKHRCSPLQRTQQVLVYSRRWGGKLVRVSVLVSRTGNGNCKTCKLLQAAPVS